MHEFRMPDIGEGLTEAEIVQWHVSVGDVVAIDQIIVEVETAKTVVEIPSVFSGTVVRIEAAAGDTVNVGDVLFVVQMDGEIAPDPAPEDQESDKKDRQPDRIGDGHEPVGIKPVQPQTNRSIRAMPLVRRLAEERGVDLTAIAGTGPGGTITRADVENTEPAGSPDGELIPLTQMRRTIADHMAQSWREIPHVTVQAEIRAEGLIGARSRGDTALSLESIVAERIIPLLREFPDFNASFSAEGVLRRSDIHLGFAVDTEAGLMVVVVRNADQKSVAGIDAEFTRLAEAARNRTIAPGEVTGQTFTISNIGALGGGHGTPIIPIGTTAIMSIGRALDQPVVVAGALEIGSVAPIDLSYDHRVIDGGLGQRFLSAVIKSLET